ncbi:C2H2-type zinc finger protein [Pseudomonas sp. CCC3.1]|uniref:C2H2-type zinc finger protein n=1 Tax=Pseudomonas sp. CCC3.1 TaxID=3048607 RepID=UPI002AC96362|nr:RHS repeat-associated core domain-containing protein [Pseudomonas sp. CCC3.1]WPX38388.1 RHS repeat-associated core domain-containing protein [Pseudomonas sp. CCC3.1]
MTSLHARTPTLAVIEPRGLPVRSVAFACSVSGQTPEQRVTWSTFDPMGRLVAQRDPRLFADSTAPANLLTVYSLSGQVLATDSTDAGWRLSLPGEAGQTLEVWDARESHWQTTYDDSMRPVSVTENSTHVIERFTYASTSVESARHNRCGRLLRHDDPAGTRHMTEYGLAGGSLEETQQFLRSLDLPHWPESEAQRDPLLEEVEPFINRWHYNAAGELLRQTDAEGHQQHFSHTVAGQLRDTGLQTAGSSAVKILVSNIRYNAFSQVESETAGNGVVTFLTHESATGRLARLQAQVPGKRLLQDLHYRYDPVGNLIEIEDTTLGTRHFANQRIEPIRRFAYDSLYQLIDASGWETAQPSLGPDLPTWQTPDTSRVVNYSETYRYDAAGNLLERIHLGGSDHTQTLHIAPHNNRVIRSGETEHTYDSNGNLLTLQPGQPLQWDARNQLCAIAQVTRKAAANDEERYIYGGGGKRLRKVRTWQAQANSHLAETRYLPGLEVRTNSATQENLQVVTLQAGRCRVQWLHWDTPPSGLENDQLRYTFDDHLGSSTLELDDQAQLISQETYYPFGGTACWVGRNEVEASYKTLRYSGKERDATGLYYYGYRYYAPWLYRWLNPDPGGAIDGLNLYRFVGNAPMGHVDADGRIKRRADGSLIAEAAGSESGFEQFRDQYIGDESLDSFSDIGDSRDSFANAPPTPAAYINNFDEGLFSTPSSPAPSLSDFDMGLLPPLGLQAPGPQPGTSSQDQFRVPAVPALQRFDCVEPGCGKSYTNMQNLTRHLLSHTGEKRFSCPNCPSRFARKDVLDIHLRIHTGEKTFSCEYPGCGKSFGYKSNLKNHLRVHTGAKPFSCTYAGCGKSFSQKHALASHQHVHTGARPFTCTYAGCTQSFRQKSNLAMHLKRKHP